METFDPSIATTLVAMGVGVLMVRVGVGKRLLEWRAAAERRRRRRR